jgi:hypothetical protein
VPLATRSRPIVGRATLTIVMSIMSISTAPTITIAASQRRGKALCREGSGAAAAAVVVADIWLLL